jgi:hypothetical protein
VPSLTVNEATELAYFCAQYDSFDIGFITADEFTSADILEATYPTVEKRLRSDWQKDPPTPIVTEESSLGQLPLRLLMFGSPLWKEIA